ncbi:MAG TPA: hypothetical protein VF860_00940 [Candidatus Acidoferrales bacterium]
MVELTPAQISVLESLAASGFQITRLPLYENAIAVVAGNCAALLGADANSRLRLLAPPSFRIGNNLAVRVTRGARDFFVWRKKELEATSARLQELEQFTATIKRILGESSTS